MNNLLLFIDFQKIFNEQDKGWHIPNLQKALDNALKVKEYFDWNFNASTQTVSTRYIPPMNITKEWTNYFNNEYPNVPTRGEHALYDLIENVPSSYVISVPKFSKWKAIGRSTHINEPNNVYITGVSTDCCVLSTALSAVDSGYKVYIISDACAAPSNQDHLRALEVMKGFKPNLEIITTEELLSGKKKEEQKTKTLFL